MSYFTICGSKTLVLGKLYKLSLNSHGGEKTHKFNISINSKEKQQIISEDVEITGEENRIIELDMRDQPVDNYFVKIVNSTDDPEEKKKFDSKTISLHMNTTRAAIVIQTDKGVYKPSDIVRFRVIAFDVETKPYISSKSEILIVDGKQNILKRISNPNWSNGIFQDELELSDQPIIGNWEIKVKIDDDMENSKSFEVAEYVLPNIEVIIDTKKDIHVSSGKLTADISAKYTYGKFAKGKASVTLSGIRQWTRCWGPSAHEHFFNPVTKSIDLEEKSTVEFDISELKDHEDFRYDQNQILSIRVEFQEEITEKTFQGSTDINVHVKKSKIVFIKDDEKFFPGLPFKIAAKITSFDDQPLMPHDDEKVTLKLELHRSWEEKIENPNRPTRKVRHSTVEEFEELLVLKDGLVEYKIDSVIELEHTVSINATITYKSDSSSEYFSKPNSSGDHFLKSKVEQNGNSLTVHIATTEEIQSLEYKIFGLNDIVESKNVKFEPTKTASFSVDIPEKYRQAEIKIFFFYIRSNGEMVFDTKIIQCNGTLKNSLELSMSHEKSKPKEEIEMSLTTAQDSVIGMLAVDKSVLLMNHDNDFTKSSIITMLKGFSGIDNYNYEHGDYFYSILDSIDAFLITNSVTVQEQECRRYAACGSLTAMPMRAMAKVRKMEDAAPLGFQAMAMEAQGTLFGGIAEADNVQAEGDGSAISVRKDFPETWFYDLIPAENGTAKLSKIVPDTITSWIINGFSMSSTKGLGMLDLPRELTVFQPFFVSANLPYSIKRGEIVSIQFLVFNYLQTEQDVELTFFNDDKEFEFEDNENKTISSVSKVIKIKSNDAVGEKFTVKPLKVGRMKIKVRAVSKVAGDMIEQFLLVKPEGTCVYKNEAFMVKLQEKNEFKKLLKIVTPTEIVPGSKRIDISVIGDVMGPTLDNLHNLIRIPYGCGEQNMLNFVPNIIVLNYLNNMKKMTPKIFTKAKLYMEKGYQKEMTYKHNDGSFSAFGMSDRSGCTWLTAFVVKSFCQALKYIDIDTEVIKNSLNFLSRIQAEDGSFPEVGTLFHKEMQGGASGGVSLTAYVLISFMSYEKSKELYSANIEKALKFIEKKLDSVKDNYSLAILAHTLQILKHPKKDSVLAKLDSNSCQGDGLTYWTVDGREQEVNEKPRSLNIEITGYALQAYLEAGREKEGFSILKWLISQRNSKGGFYSTQDTIVGLESLSKAAVYAGDSNKNIEISAKYLNKVTKFGVNDENALVLQNHVFTPEAESIELTATGQGTCIVQLSAQYHVKDTEKNLFNLETKIAKSEGLKLVINVNVSYDSEKESNMVVLEMEFPSGFKFDNDSKEEILKNREVKRIETKENDTSVAVYFNELDKVPQNLIFRAIKCHEVSNLKPAEVKVYDYYDNVRVTSSFYQI